VALLDFYKSSLFSVLGHATIRDRIFVYGLSQLMDILAIYQR
jgi:hypothetical protein